MSNRDTVKETYVKIVERHLRPLLVARGFKAGVKQFLQVTPANHFRVTFSLQCAPRDPNAIMSVSASVAFPKLWDLLRQCEVFSRTQLFTAAACGGNILTLLSKQNLPRWHMLSASSDSDALGSELHEQFEEVVLPFLERHSDVQEALKYWSHAAGRFAPMTRTGALWLIGRRDAAVSELAQAVGEAEERYSETQASGHLARVQELKHFRDFLESRDKRGGHLDL